MNARHIVTSILVIAVITLLTVLAFHVRIGATADAVAVLRTTGMTCGSCSSRIKSALESQKGVAATEVDVNGGWVVVGYDTKAVGPESLAEKVRGAGFGSTLYQVITPEQFRTITGRNVGQHASPSKGCCGGRNGGCGMNKS